MLSERGVGKRTCLSTGNDRGSRMRPRTEPSLGQIQSYRDRVKIVRSNFLFRPANEDLSVETPERKSRRAVSIPLTMTLNLPWN
jgi:hypothetical protein